MREIPWFLEPNSDTAMERVLSYRNTSLNPHPMSDLWKRGYNYYYSCALTGDAESGLEFLGDDQNLIKTTVNEARSLIRQYCSIATKQKLSFEAITSSTEAVTLSNTRLAKQLLEWVVKSKKVDEKADRFGESALVFGSAFMGALWRADAGDNIFVQGDAIVSNGDIDIFNIQLEDIFFDYRVESFDRVDSCEFRIKTNKYNLAYHYPDAEQDILNNSDATDSGYACDSSDNIYLYYWFLKPSKLAPKGRMIISLEDGTVLRDGDNQYGCIPVVMCVPESFQTNECCYGYPKILDLLPLQESFNSVYSAITTNLTALGIQSILAPEGCGISSQDIGGLNFITYQPGGMAGGGKIESLQLSNNAPDSYKYLDMARSHMTELSGLNGVLRGSPPPGITSGIALTTLSANALEFMQSFSKAWQNSIEELMTLVVKVYSVFTVEPKSLPVSTVNNATMAQSFVGTDLKHISQIKFSVNSPKTLTAGGRIELAQQLLSAGLIKNPSEFMQVIETGSVESLTDNSLDKLNLIYSENDDLRSGETVQALALDMHAEHIQAHSTILDDTTVRRLAGKYREGMVNSPDVENAYRIASNVLNHIQEHLELQKNTDPELMAMAATGVVPQQPPPTK